MVLTRRRHGETLLGARGVGLAARAVALTMPDGGALAPPLITPATPGTIADVTLI